MKVLLATHNKHKRIEIKSLLKGFKNVTVLNLNDLETEMPTIVEDGKTFRQNAVKKTVIISKFYDGLVLADDSGLEVDALDGRPGVRSARFARAKATDEENVKKLLNLMRNVPESKRKARFVCCIALSENGVLLGTYQGEVKGDLIYETRGKNGFGYDPIFIPKGYETTFAEMDAILKNKISHRAIALNKFKQAMSKIVGPEEVIQQELELDLGPVKKVISSTPEKIKIKNKIVGKSRLNKEKKVVAKKSLRTESITEKTQKVEKTVVEKEVADKNKVKRIAVRKKQTIVEKIEPKLKAKAIVKTKKQKTSKK